MPPPAASDASASPGVPRRRSHLHYADLDAWRDELRRRDDACERDRGVKSSRALIAADAEWEALYQRVKAAEFALASDARLPDQCAKYVARRRRFCASRAADGCEGFCSLHAPGLGESPSSAAAEDRRRRPRVVPPEPSSRAAESGDGDGGASAEERVDAPGVLAAADDERHHRRPRRQVSSLKTNIHRRMKKMTNPLAEKHRAPTPPPDWSAVFSDPDRPTVVDVGCAKGRFLQRAATSDAERFERDASRLLGGEGGTAEPPFNFLGLEIYEPIVLDALRWTEARYRERSDTDERATLKRDEGITDAEGISEGGSTTGRSGGETRARTRTHTRTQTQTQTPGVKQTDAGCARTLPKNYSRGRNLHFIACNANASLPGFVASGLRVDLLCVLFPDPWSRRKHASRRVVTPEFVRALADAARPGARVYCCSDVRALAEEMQALIVNEGGAAFELDEETYRRVGEAEFECEEGAGPGGAGGERGASGIANAPLFRERSRASFAPRGEKPTSRAARRSAAAAGRDRDASSSGGGVGVASTESDALLPGPERKPGSEEDFFEHVFPAHAYAWAAGGEAGGEGALDPSDAAAGAETRGARVYECRWLAANPLGVPTERDLVCESKWRPVYRFVARRR